ncbi:hypothetical protein C2845_PM11G07310 [Panicum miliaceum]|uniref:Skin secretory protein xP2-like n=1 Tax=Panicum miliaceum TaxID=4540 RepID=A0A3L6RMM5_PANMI|nr:hypothetical protein C2845_PM11G07310 [Panicum miliaceum]
MGAAATTAPLRRSCPLLALLLCFQVLRTSQAFKLRGGGGYEEEKVPLAVIVPDPSPHLSGFSPAPLAAPPPVFGGGGDDMRPRLPTERWRRGKGEARRSAAHAPAASSHSHCQAPAPSAGPGPARAPAPGGPEAPAPDSAGGSGGSASIKSSPAVPVPRGVTDTATILPMPAPGEKRQEVGAATSVGAGLVPPLLLGLLIVMMASFGL